MKKLKKSSIFIILFIFIMAACAGGFFYFKSSKNTAEKNQTTELLLSASQFKYDGNDKLSEYFISNLPSDYIWKFEFKEESLKNKPDLQSLITIYDEDEKAVKLNIIRKKSIVSVNPPEGGYRTGSTYRLKISDQLVFANDDLNDKRDISFTVKSPEVEKAELKQNVKQLDYSIVTYEDSSLIKFDKSKISKLSVNDILVISPINDFQSGRIVEAKEIKESGNEYEVKVENKDFFTPFESIDIHKEYEGKAEYFIPSENAEVEKETEKKGLSLFPTYTVHAAEEDGVTAEHKSGDKAKFKIKPSLDKLSITIPFTELLEGGKGPSLGFEGTIDYYFPKTSVDCDYKIAGGLRQFDFKSDDKVDGSLTLKAEMKTKDENPGLKDLSPNRQELKDINKLYSNKKMNEKIKKIGLGQYIIPTAIPGVAVSFDVDLVAKLDAKGEFSFSIQYYNRNTFGFHYSKKEGIRKFGGSTDKQVNTQIKISGNVTQKVGLEVDGGLTFIKIASVEATAGTGAFAEVSGEGEVDTRKIVKISESAAESSGKVDKGASADYTDHISAKGELKAGGGIYVDIGLKLSFGLEDTFFSKEFNVKIMEKKFFLFNVLEGLKGSTDKLEIVPSEKELYERNNSYQLTAGIYDGNQKPIPIDFNELKIKFEKGKGFHIDCSGKLFIQDNAELGKHKVTFTYNKNGHDLEKEFMLNITIEGDTNAYKGDKKPLFSPVNGSSSSYAPVKYPYMNKDFPFEPVDYDTMAKLIDKYSREAMRSVNTKYETISLERIEIDDLLVNNAASMLALYSIPLRGYDDGTEQTPIRLINSNLAANTEMIPYLPWSDVALDVIIRQIKGVNDGIDKIYTRIPKLRPNEDSYTEEELRLIEYTKYMEYVFFNNKDDINKLLDTLKALSNSPDYGKAFVGDNPYNSFLKDKMEENYKQQTEKMEYNFDSVLTSDKKDLYNYIMDDVLGR